MKRLLLIVLFPLCALTQTTPDTCFTQQEIIDISYTLDSLYAADSINLALIKKFETLTTQQASLIKLDSIQLVYKNQQINLLQENVNLYIQRERYLKPKWYDSKGLWFAAGIFTTLGSGILINEILK
jgi:agmatine/peptidylarginine deiminase